jgi:hypothetical protein
MKLTLRGYARRRKSRGLSGTTLHAVQCAISSGRLDRSLTPDRKAISDPDLADREWSDTTNDSRVPITGPTAGAAGAVELPPGVPPAAVSRARREAALAGLAEHELAKCRGQVVDVDSAREDVIAKFSMVKTRLLRVPSLARQRDPSLTAKQVAQFDALLRDALEELSTPALAPEEP